MRILVILFSLTLYCFPIFAKLKYEKVGSWDLQLDGSTFGMTSNSSYSTYFPGGKITLKNGSGKINICVEDAIFLDETRMVFEIECHITMDDNSVVFLEYNVKVTTDETWNTKIMDGSDISAPDNGLKVWNAEFKMKTKSKKYDWINNYIFIGKGLELRGSTIEEPLGRAYYDLYIINN
ncbi:MAG: hypothetical protein CMP24_06915 [Rickettsiales bacterium]|nr:hypothetical protein [Rickettsiales bacterium]|tara:strand:+ start:702 stop:1238 length:537 start_codon:yes stop_codon:yes gene_type:complete